jgi:hypothetical protein
MAKKPRSIKAIPELPKEIKSRLVEVISAELGRGAVGPNLREISHDRVLPDKTHDKGVTHDKLLVPPDVTVENNVSLDVAGVDIPVALIRSKRKTKF